MAQEKLINIEIVTPQKVVFSGKAQSVTLPGSLAPFQVLYNHAPIVSSLDLGIIRIVDENNKKLFYASNSGFAEVSKNNVSILVEKADFAGDISIEEVKQDLNEYREKLKTIDKVHFEEIKIKIKELENRLTVVQKQL